LGETVLFGSVQLSSAWVELHPNSMRAKLLLFTRVCCQKLLLTLFCF